jgi:hypothetical protein
MRELSGGQDADAFIPAVQEEVNQLRSVDPDLVPNAQYHLWLESLKKLDDAGLRGGDRARMRAVDDSAYTLAKAPERVPLAEQLERVRAVDADDLTLVVAAVAAAVQTVDAAYVVAKPWVDALGQRKDHADLQAAAKRMREAGEALLTIPKVSHG